MPHVLLATDADWLVDQVTAALGGPDTSFTVVREGRLVCKVVGERQPDLAILDVKMPNVDGLDVCRRMKKVTRLKDVPVMILTALRDEATLEAARLAGADAVVIKPLEGKDFRTQVKQLMREPDVAEV